MEIKVLTNSIAIAFQLWMIYSINKRLLTNKEIALLVISLFSSVLWLMCALNESFITVAISSSIIFQGILFTIILKQRIGWVIPIGALISIISFAIIIDQYYLVYILFANLTLGCILVIISSYKIIIHKRNELIRMSVRTEPEFLDRSS